MHMPDETFTAFVSGDFDFAGRHRLGPYWHTMFDDIERTMRAMHNGRLVLNLRRLVPSTPSVVHVHVRTISRPACAA